MAVVEATKDKNTPPNKMPDNSNIGHAEVKAGKSVAKPSKAFKMASVEITKLENFQKKIVFEFKYYL